MKKITGSVSVYMYIKSGFLRYKQKGFVLQNIQFNAYFSLSRSLLSSIIQNKQFVKWFYWKECIKMWLCVTVHTSTGRIKFHACMKIWSDSLTKGSASSTALSYSWAKGAAAQRKVLKARFCEWRGLDGRIKLFQKNVTPPLSARRYTLFTILI